MISGNLLRYSDSGEGRKQPSALGFFTQGDRPGGWV